LALHVINYNTGGPDAPDLQETLQNFGINSVAFAVLSFLVYRDVKVWMLFDVFDVQYESDVPSGMPVTITLSALTCSFVLTAVLNQHQQSLPWIQLQIKCRHHITDLHCNMVLFLLRASLSHFAF
jgi:hypothetical protein